MEVNRDYRSVLSSILMETSEEKHMECDIYLNTAEDCGLSDLEKMHVTEIWQHPTEGIIMLMVEGVGECELEDYEECIPQIYNELIEQEGRV